MKFLSFWPIFVIVYLIALFGGCLTLAWREGKKGRAETVRRCKLHTWLYGPDILDDNGAPEYRCKKCGFHTGYRATVFLQAP